MESKIYKISENQIKAIAAGQNIKELFPELFELNFEVGKVYKYTKYPKFITFIREDKTSYGFDIYGLWFDYGCETIRTEGYVEATHQEWVEALIEEAKKRYKEGDYVKCVYGGNVQKISHQKFSYMEKHGSVVSHEEFDDSVALFLKGIWAEIIQTITKAEVLEKYNLTVID